MIPGPGFDWPDELPEIPDLESESSRGLFLMNSLMDEVSYEKLSDHNIISFKKNIPKSITNPKSDQNAPETKKRHKFEHRKVLIIEPNMERAKQCADLLKAVGMEPVIKITDEAIAKVLKRSVEFVVVIINIFSSRFDGLMITKKLTEKHSKDFLPILALVPEENKGRKIEAFTAGCLNHLDVPINEDEFNLKMDRMLRLGNMAKTMVKSSREMEAQLKDAKKFLQTIIPAPLKMLKNISFYSFFRPCNYIGGDMLSSFQLDENRIGFYVADVSGHGVVSAMIALWLHKTMSPQMGARSAITKKKINTPPYYEIIEPDEVCTTLDRLMAENESDQYLTMFYGIIDMKTGEISYCCGGHPAPYIIDNKGKVTSLDCDGPPVGMGLDLEYTRGEHTLREGERLFIFSDCAIEIDSPDGVQFGEENLEKSLEETSNLDPGEQLESISKILFKYYDSENLTDDLTMLNVIYKNKGNDL